MADQKLLAIYHFPFFVEKLRTRLMKLTILTKVSLLVYFVCFSIESIIYLLFQKEPPKKEISKNFKK